RPCPSGVHLQDHRIALATAGANTDRGDTASPAAKFVDGRQHQPGAARTDGVPEGDRAAVDVDLLRVDTKAATGDDRDAGKRFVDLEEIDVVDRDPRLVGGLAN